MELPQDDNESEQAYIKAEGVPSLEDSFIQKYLDGRDALVNQEKRQRSDHAFRETLSPMAAEASAIVSAIRFEEQETLWRPGFEEHLVKSQNIDFFPGMMFFLAKERMRESKLWRIVKKMPKGALLHCHLGAMGEPDWMIEQAFATPGMCITCEVSLHTPVLRKTCPFRFRFGKPTETGGSASLWDESYKSGTLVPVETAAASFPDGGKEGFTEWLKSRITITPEEALQQHAGPHAIWTKFISCFGILASLQHYEPIFRRFIRHVLESLHQDGVRWVEFRSVFVLPFYRKDSETADDDFSGMMSIMQEEIDEFVASDEGKDFWGARLIWTTMRHGGTRDIVEDMKTCIKMKTLFPDLISGYDLVGQEDLGRPLAELTPELFWFKKRCAEEGVDLPFFFHAGETLGDGDIVDENLFDAVLLGTRRLGHGFSLYKHPLLCDMVKEKRIMVESCPVSNEILRLTGSIMSHPLPALLARGVNCSLSTDDPSILGQGNDGMTHDFWQALQGWENLGLEGLASLAENSVRWAAYEDCSAKEWAQEIKNAAFGTGVRAEKLKKWAQEFEKFCQWVVLEFGDEQDIQSLD